MLVKGQQRFLASVAAFLQSLDPVAFEQGIMSCDLIGKPQKFENKCLVERPPKILASLLHRLSTVIWLF
jgi:hypothetical protein